MEKGEKENGVKRVRGKDEEEEERAGGTEGIGGERKEGGGR